MWKSYSNGRFHSQCFCCYGNFNCQHRVIFLKSTGIILNTKQYIGEYTQNELTGECKGMFYVHVQIFDALTFRVHYRYRNNIIFTTNQVVTKSGARFEPGKCSL
jgi:hypothetical protein